MVRGLVKQASYFQMRLERVSASATTGAGFIGETTSFFRSNSSDFAVGIQLRYTYAGAGGDLVEINVPSLGVSWSDTTYGDLEARLYGDIHAEDDTWHISNAVFRGYRAGALVVTASAGNLQSLFVQKVPSSIPLIGIPPLVMAYGFLPSIAGPPAGLSVVSSSVGYGVDLATFAFSGSGDASVQEAYSFSGAVRGGWRWDVGGTKEQFSTRLQLITPPTINCSVSAPSLPNVTSSDTWTNTADALGTSVINGAAVESTIQASWIQPDPDLPRRYRRLGDDYSALCVRFGLPRARRHGLARCNTNRNDTFEQVIPERAQYLGIVGINPDVYEDALNDRPECLYNRQAQHFVSPDGFNGTVHEKVSEFGGTDAPPAGYIPALNAPDQPITCYWDFLCNPHWSHKLWFEDWTVDGENQDCNLYWCPIRSQWQYHAALPSNPALTTRNHILLDCIDSAVDWHEGYIGHGIRNLGACRWQTVDCSPWSSHVYSSSSSALFSTVGASAVYGANIALTTASSSVQLDLRLGSHSITPYQAIHLADQLRVNWSATNITSAVWYVVGYDNVEQLVTNAANVWTDLPSGASTCFAGSWGLDNGAQLVVDTGADSASGTAASGISALIAADPQLIHAFELMPGRTYTTLRAKITTVASTGLALTISYPEFRRNEGTDPSMPWETGQTRCLLYKNHAGVRFGNTRWWDDVLLKMRTLPVVRGAGYRETAVDHWGTKAVWLEKAAPASGAIVTDLRARFNSVEGSSLVHFGSNTAAPWLPNPSFTRVQLALTNDWAEVPPLCLAPRKARDTDWQETGGFCLDVWSWIVGRSRFIKPAPTFLDLWNPDETTKATLPESGYVDGWAVAWAQPQLDNNEENWRIKVQDIRYGLVRPFRGYKAVIGHAVVASGETMPWLFQEESGRLHRTSVSNGRIVYRMAESTVPVPNWKIQTTLTDAGSAAKFPRSVVDSCTRRIWLSYIYGGSIFRTYSDDDGRSFSTPELIV